MRRIGYIRVSTKEQNLDRQMKAMIELNIEEKNIYYDEASGGKFDDRLGYKYMKRSLREGDVLYILSLDRFGRNYNQIIEEWNDITKNIGADIVVLDMELLNTTKHKDLLGNFMSDLILQVLSFVAQKEIESMKKRQKDGIQAAQERGVAFGRPRIKIDEHKFKQVYDRWKNAEITAVSAIKELGLSKSVFYSRVKEYEKKNNK